MDQEKQKLTQSWEVLKQWQWWLSWFGIFAGSTVLAAGFVFFINPYNIVPGGVYGASIVLHNLFPSIQVGTFG
ncbi:MAG: YitT family protein, partial [bacterium]|nr:YitT family protein [bacterium]